MIVTQIWYLPGNHDILAGVKSPIGLNWFKRFWKALSQPALLSATTVGVFAPAPAEQAMCNFTPRAQQVLALSRKEADRFNHNFVGTEHLLLGLIALGQGVAVNILEKLGLDLENVRMEVEKQVGTGPDRRMVGNIPYTPRVKKVLALADKERHSLGHTYLGTEHILLGILSEGDGVAGRVLQNLDVNIEQTRLEILKELDPNFDSGNSATEP
jgi:ATP-dependent Clp protease ATP-binding subunit ClpC